jgi:hypothetical protein
LVSRYFCIIYSALLRILICQGQTFFGLERCGPEFWIGFYRCPLERLITKAGIMLRLHQGYRRMRLLFKYQELVSSTTKRSGGCTSTCHFFLSVLVSYTRKSLLGLRKQSLGPSAGTLCAGRMDRTYQVISVETRVVNGPCWRILYSAHAHQLGRAQLLLATVHWVW